MEKSLTWIRPVAVLAILLLFLTTWGLAGPGKLFSSPPAWFSEKFGATFLGTFPGIPASYYSIAIGETLAALLALAALLRREFLPGRVTVLTQWMLVLSLLIFAQLGFGQRLVGEFNSAASLFFYFGATLLALIFVRAREA